MAVELGTNCGFVTTAPTADPVATVTTVDGFAVSIKDTVPATATKITEIGWWKSGVTNVNWEAGAYTHDTGNDRPASLLSGGSGANATGTTSGVWLSATVDIDVSSYQGGSIWLAIQIDAHAGASYVDQTSGSGTIGIATSQATLPATWPDVSSTIGLISVYALYETGPSGPAIPVIMNQYRQRRR